MVAHPKSKIKNLESKIEHSAGGCVYKKQDGNTLWLLGKHSGYHKWVLPKGLIEVWETPSQAAVREVEEELTVKAFILGYSPIHTIHYTFKSEPIKVKKTTRRVRTYQEEQNFHAVTHKITTHKTVDFFLMKYVSGDASKHGWEMEASGWFAYSEALKLLDFPDEKKALKLAHATMHSHHS